MTPEHGVAASCHLCCLQKSDNLNSCPTQQLAKEPTGFAYGLMDPKASDSICNPDRWQFQTELGSWGKSSEFFFPPWLWKKFVKLTSEMAVVGKKAENNNLLFLKAHNLDHVL